MNLDDILTAFPSHQAWAEVIGIEDSVLRRWKREGKITLRYQLLTESLLREARECGLDYPQLTTDLNLLISECKRRFYKKSKRKRWHRATVTSDSVIRVDFT